MAYTSDAKVRQIIKLGASVDTLAPFIAAAHRLLVAKITLITDPEYLELIERYLAAHFAAISNPRRLVETVGPLSQTLQVPKLGQGLKGTVYGQQALLLDTSGALAAYQKLIEDGGPTELMFFTSAQFPYVPTT